MSDMWFLRAAIIGALPLMIAIDGIASSVVFSLYCAISLTIATVFLYPLRNVDSQLKYLAAAALCLPANLAAFNYMSAAGHYTGWMPEFCVCLASLPVAGITLGRYMHHIGRAGECLKYYFLTLLSTVSLLLLTGAAVSGTLAMTGAFEFHALSYPGAVMVLAGLLAPMMKKVLEKLV